MLKYLFIAGNLYLRALRSFSNWNQNLFGSLFWGSYGRNTSPESSRQKNKSREQYDDKQIAQGYVKRYLSSVFEFGGRERQLLLAVLYCLNKLKHERQSGFTFGDLGGGPGVHFDLLQKYLEPGDIYEYKIIETQCMREACLGEKSINTDDRKKFFTLADFPFKVRTDVFIAVGSLSYVDDWKTTLASILSNTQFLIIDTIPLTEGSDEIYARQYAIKPVYDESASYPITYIPKQDFESFLTQHKFRIEYSHEDPYTSVSLNLRKVTCYTYVASRIETW